MTTLLQQLITKMGLRDEPNVLEKTTELVRLLDLRSTNVPLQINEYGKIVLCADIAANLMGIPFDKEQALKLSGLRKSHYANNKRMFEKLLDLNKLVGVNDICIQLSLNQVNKKAEELLDLYRNVIASEQSTDVDMSHPQYAAMAVFMACKLSKQKVSKSKLMPFSNLKPSQWQQLEQRWEKFMTKHYNDAMDNKLKKQNSDNQATAATDDDSSKKIQVDQKMRTEIEDYEKWKKRMLAMAQAKLKEQEADSESSEQMDNPKDIEFTDVIDNMILGC
ncbi:origin recognition complex subunit 6 [Calliphora vicina]|uniref:origin recognition complex subunit 6 n=1 Tax=Calliphora vicina TaxID=7373 RepID=UPI00325C0017